MNSPFFCAVLKKHTISITWDVTPRGLVYRYQGFKTVCYFYIRCNLTRNTEVERASVTIPTLEYMPCYRVPYRREQKSSIIPLCEPHTCHSNRCALPWSAICTVSVTSFLTTTLLMAAYSSIFVSHFTVHDSNFRLGHTKAC